MDTEKPTSNRIISRFYDFQPIETSYDFKLKFLPCSCKREQLEKFRMTSPPNWIKEKNNTNKLYENLFVFPINLPETTNLTAILLRFHLIDTNKDLDSFFHPEQTQVYLVYDMKLRTFMLTLELEFEFDSTNLPFICNNGFQTDDIPRIDMYNAIRSTIVYTENQDINSTYLHVVEKEIQSKIKEIVFAAFGISVSDTDFYLRLNNGNITNVVFCNDASSVASTMELFLKINKKAERLDYDCRITESNDCFYSFNGRFHTIVTANQKKLVHFIPIQYHAQFIWGYLDSLNSTIENINITLQEKTQDCFCTEINALIRALIEKTEILSFQNEAFKRSIENEYEVIYKNIENKWQLNSALQATQKYINNLSNYLNREYMIENQKSDDRQNKILFSISILQILAFISIWNDFLNLEMSYGTTLNLFNNMNALVLLQIINLVLPLVLVAISIVLLISTFHKKKK